MSTLVLVDTSAWTQALRRNGDAQVRARVEELLAQEAAVWRDPVRLELWNGVRGIAEKEKLRRMEAELASLSITDEVWSLACNYAERARSQGLNTPATDLIIFACARFHNVNLEHVDRHFDLLDNLK